MKGSALPRAQSCRRTAYRARWCVFAAGRCLSDALYGARWPSDQTKRAARREAHAFRSALLDALLEGNKLLEQQHPFFGGSFDPGYSCVRGIVGQRETDRSQSPPSWKLARLIYPTSRACLWAGGAARQNSFSTAFNCGLGIGRSKVSST